MPDFYGTTASANTGILWNGTGNNWTGTATTWTDWNTTYTTYTTAGTSANSEIIWGTWNGNRITQAFTGVFEPETNTEREQRLERERLASAERNEAKKRAQRLLMGELTPKQRKSYKRDGFFTVISQDGERTYRIRRGRSGNVELINPNGQVIRRYCAHPIEHVPDDDTVLAQKLMLETCEDQFLRLANAS